MKQAFNLIIKHFNDCYRCCAGSVFVRHCHPIGTLTADVFVMCYTATGI